MYLWSRVINIPNNIDGLGKATPILRDTSVDYCIFLMIILWFCVQFLVEPFYINMIIFNDIPFVYGQNKEFKVIMYAIHLPKKVFAQIICIGIRYRKFNWRNFHLSI
jgi:hypothetical protein